VNSTARHTLVVLPLLLLAACASGPTFNTSQVDRTLTPAVVTAGFHNAKGKQVLWGGVIRKTTNLADKTLIEMQAYPLGYQEKPQRDAAPTGHFLLEKSGCLEPLSYADGRLLTVTGTVLRTETGRPGQTYPVIDARELYLWPVDTFHDSSGLRFGGEIGAGDTF
jgi:outer membrane lipoprotein